MEAVEVLRAAQVAAFLGLSLAAIVQWLRHRSRPAAYLAGTFAAIGVVVLAARLVSPEASTTQSAISHLTLLSLAAFPWLLAAFAWSFEGALPRWLRGAGALVGALAAWSLTLPPLVGAEARTSAQQAYLLAFVVVWAVLAALSAWRLWMAGSGQRLVRARVRLMSAAAVVLTAALVATALSGPDPTQPVEVLTRLLALTSAIMFGAGFAPPLPLRLWWRRSASREFQRLQTTLISAATPSSVATAVAPMLADLVGGAVVIVDEHGEVLAAAEVDAEEARRLAAHGLAGAPPDHRTYAVPVADGCLVVRGTPYTPLFGSEERELVDAFSLHLQLALERAELYRSEQAAREEAEATRRELEGMLYGLSHDLKNPTLAISGFVDLLEDATDDQHAEMVAHLRASSAYLRQLVDALLELSRAGRAQTSVEPVDLAETVRAVAERVEVTHPQATVRVTGELPPVTMNPVRTQQLLDNLVSNALWHGGRADVTVTVAARNVDGRVELEVADDGRGIPAGDRERIFELFQRGSTSTARGSGVGLGIVRRIAESAGGWVVLADSDRGARFVVGLPGAAPSDGDEPTLADGRRATEASSAQDR